MNYEGSEASEAHRIETGYPNGDELHVNVPSLDDMRIGEPANWERNRVEEPAVVAPAYSAAELYASMVGTPVQELEPTIRDDAIQADSPPEGDTTRDMSEVVTGAGLAPEDGSLAAAPDEELAFNVTEWFPSKHADTTVDVPLDRDEGPEPTSTTEAALGREIAINNKSDVAVRDTLQQFTAAAMLDVPPKVTSSTVVLENVRLVERPNHAEYPATAHEGVSEGPQKTTSEIAVREFPRMTDILQGFANEVTHEWREPRDLHSAADAYGEIIARHKIAWDELGSVLGGIPVHGLEVWQDKKMGVEGINAAWKFTQFVTPDQRAGEVTVLMRAQCPAGRLPTDLKCAAQYLKGSFVLNKPRELIGVPLGLPLLGYDKEQLAQNFGKAFSGHVHEAEIVYGSGIGRYSTYVKGVHPDQERMLQDLQDACTTQDWLFEKTTRQLLRKVWAERWPHTGGLTTQYPSEPTLRRCLARLVSRDISKVGPLQNAISNLTRHYLDAYPFDPKVRFSSLENIPWDRR